MEYGIFIKIYWGRPRAPPPFSAMVSSFFVLQEVLGVKMFFRAGVGRRASKFQNNLATMGHPAVARLLQTIICLAHRNRSGFSAIAMPIADPRNRERFPRQDKAMLHCDLRVRWKVASDLRFRAAISEPKTPSFCRISGDLAQSTRTSPLQKHRKN